MRLRCRAAAFYLPLSAAALLSLSMQCSEDRTPSPETAGEASAGAATAGEPRVRLRLSGAMDGHLEPCGCASGQLGGLPRRVFNIKRERDYDLLIEGGNLVAGSTPLDLQKLTTALTILSMPDVGYHALGIGSADLELPMDQLCQLLALFEIPAVSSDLVADEQVAWPGVPYLERSAGPATVRLASLTLHKPGQAAGALLSLRQPAAAWELAMRGASPDTLRILLVHGTPEEARTHAALTPRPDLVVGITELVAEPPARPEIVDGVPLVFPGSRGRMLLDVTLTRRDGQPHIADYHVVPLAGSQTAKGALEDETAKLILLDHRHQVKAEGIREQMAERLPTANGASYVGSSACIDCHEEAFAAWQKTKHAHAWTTLERAEAGDRYGWPVTYYPDCVSCHVVGYGQQTGFVNPEKTPDLRGVGCEQCHGPGSKHVESGGEGWIARSDARDCTSCHNHEQSPHFANEYQERWEKIKH